MTFFCISNPRQKQSIRLLEKACQELQVSFLLVTPENFTAKDSFIPQTGDIVYRVSDTYNADVMEIEFFYLSHKVASFYKDNNPSLVNLEEHDSYLLSIANVPTPKTFFYLPQNRELLDRVIEELGGYPIVIKALGGSHGVGIMRIDSQQSMYSVVDFLKKSGQRFVIKEYIKVAESARLIVLNNTVIDSIRYTAPTSDFRSNEGHVPNVTKADFSQEIQQIAIDAVKTLGLEFGGVDILTSGGNHYVAEVNFPCYFPRAELLTGTPIARMMVEYLVGKSHSYFGK